MRTTLAIHIMGGGLGLLSGYVALYAAKGATLHRKSGIAFVYSMLAMTTFGALMAATENNNWTPVNVSAGPLAVGCLEWGLRTARPVRRQRCSSLRSAPRPWTNSDV